MAAGRWVTCSRPTDLLLTLLFLLPPSSGVSLRGSGPHTPTLRMVDVLLCDGLVWVVQWCGLGGAVVWFGWCCGLDGAVVWVVQWCGLSGAVVWFGWGSGLGGLSGVVWVVLWFGWCSGVVWGLQWCALGGCSGVVWCTGSSSVGERWCVK